MGLKRPFELKFFRIFPLTRHLPQTSSSLSRDHGHMTGGGYFINRGDGVFGLVSVSVNFEHQTGRNPPTVHLILI